MADARAGGGWVALALSLATALAGCPRAAVPPDSASPDASGATDGGGPPDGAAPADAAGATDAAALDSGPTGGIDPSGGSGGAYPGAQARTVAAPTGGAFDYYLYVPTAYDPAVAMPLVSLFHGQGDNGASMRDFWTATAEANDFIALATSSTGSMGGWDPGADGPRYNAALTDALAAYNVEQARHYLWGFSAGGHLAHGLGLANTDVFAAYAVSAGVLDAFAGAGAPSMAARTIPVDIHVGDADPLLPYATTDRDRFVAAGWTEGVDLALVVFAGPHTVYTSHTQEIWDFLAPFTLP